MKTPSRITALLLLTCITALAHAQSITGFNAYGSADNEFIHDLVRTDDGGYAAAGYVESASGSASVRSNGMKDFYVMKIDANGETEWSHNYGGSYDDEAFGIAVTENGEYLVVGCSNSSDIDVSEHYGTNETCDIWFIRLNSEGEMIFDKTYGTEGNEFAADIAVNSSNDILIAANITGTGEAITSHYGGSDFWLCAIDQNGNIQWENTYGSSGDEEINTIYLDLDDHIYLGGSTNSFSTSPFDREAWLLKADEDGEQEWDYLLSTNATAGIGKVNDIHGGPGNSIAVSYIGSLQGDDHNCNAHGSFLLAHLTYDGEWINEWCYGGEEMDACTSAFTAADGTTWIAGTSESQDGDVPSSDVYTETATRIWLAHLDENGEILWKKSLGGSNADEALKVCPLMDGKILLTGNSRSADGDVLAQHDPSGETWDIFSAVVSTLTSDIRDDDSEEEIRIYPNPAVDQTNLIIPGNFSSGRLFIYNAQGALVSTAQLSGNFHSLDISSLADGFYTCRVMNTDGIMLGSLHMTVRQ